MKKPGKKGVNESAGQRALFFPVAQAAWKKYVTATGDAVHFDDWRYAETETIFGPGVRSIKDLNQSADFDALLLHFAILLDDRALIDRCSGGDERRVRWLIDEALAQIGKMEGRPCTWAYAKSICTRMHLPEHREDCPAELLRKVYAALDYQRRRLARTGQTAVA